MNYDKYIGLRYLDNGRTESGVDCWGLARLFYKGEYGIDLPSYSEEYSGGTDPRILQTVELYKDNWEESAQPEAGDLCLFNMLGEPMHVGVYVGNNKFLHCRSGSDSVIESLSNLKWKNRFVAFYKYAPQAQVQAVGVPHPLKLSVYRDWTVAGTTVQDFVDFVKSKYTVSSEIVSKIVIMLDGVIVPKANWSTTVVQAGQEIAYKSVAEGTSTKRLLITLAAIAITATLGPTGLESLGTSIGSSVGVTGLTAGQAIAVASVSIQVGSMVLQNVIAPIRPPRTNDPGSANAMNLLNGQANQASPFNAIPVVLGKVRFSGMLGATPYVESLTETNILNSVVVWGFGPLSIKDVNIGSKPIDDFYYGEPVSVPRPITIQGFARDYVLGAAGGIDGTFNNQYGRDVEQRPVNLELTNNATNVTASHPGTRKWQQVNLVQNADAIDIVLSFPEGMRKINTKTGDIGVTTCGVEIQMRQYQAGEWAEEDSSSSVNVYSFKPGDTQAFQLFTMSPPGGLEVQLYRYTTFCLSPSGGISRFDGAATETLGQDANPEIQAEYAKTSYASLVGTSGTKTYKPQIAPGYLPLYEVYQSSNGTITPVGTSQPVDSYSGKSGLQYSVIETLESTGSGMDTVWDTSAIKTVKITSGRVYADASGVDLTAAAVEVWSTKTLFGVAGIDRKSSGGKWSPFLQDFGIWGTTDTTPAATPENPNAYGGSWLYNVPSFYFPYTGYYEVTAACDDQGEILIDGIRAVQIPKSGEKNTIAAIQGLIKLTAGFHSITLSGVNNQANDKGLGALITYTANNGVNIQPSQNTILTFGTGAWFERRKDAFNWVHSVENLPRGRYQVRVRRTNSDETEDEVDQKKFHKAILANVTAYDSEKLPMVNPPGTYLAKTGIRVQSSNKVNGQIDGINALVHTITWDYDRTTSSWENLRETNNPASLFAYVLMHPANAFRVTPSELDIPSLTAWHNFCNPVAQTVATPSMQKGRYYTIKSLGTTTQASWNILAGTTGAVYVVGNSFEVKVTGGQPGTGTVTYAPKFTYNSVLSSTQSVMDTLRDICAAGKASPTYIDGKWGVVIDTERTHTVQHFTEHNSWGFEATKILPILPHAFRITISDEDLAYQTNEIIVYNYGYGPTTEGGKIGATLFEQLNLPGVTNADQATRLARWHFAQLKLRPEVYTINVDFEHLVCTRGDKVKISHSVPQWGIGSGRLGLGVGDTVTGTALTLTEPVLLTNNTNYSILIRTNNITSTPGTGSVIRNFLYTGTTGYTSTITVPEILSTDGVKTDNLFMIGLANISTQECIVTAIEPSNEYSARLTLVDYSPEIYTADLTDLLTFNPKMSLSNIAIVKTTITKSPIITSINSTSAQSNQLASGNYQNKAIVAFTNPQDLPAVASKVQFDIIDGDVSAWDSNPGTLYEIDKNNSTFEFVNLTSNKNYKVRARYTNADRTICGPWSQDFAFNNDGKNRNFQTPPAIALDLENTYIVADPTIVSNSAEIAGYAYRLYRDSGTLDLWDTTPIIPEVINNGQGRLNLLDIPVTSTSHRISADGVIYRVACRVVDKLGNYSDTSSYGTTVANNVTYNYIKIKTIV
jgi:sulfur carrier protein ThiS